MSQLGLGMTPDVRPPRRPRGGGLAVGALLAVVLVLVVGVGAVFALTRGMRSDTAWTGSGTGEVVVTVSAGQSSAQIGQTLARAGVVRDQRAFTDAARADDRSRGIQPGSYRLRRHMGGTDALALMLDPAARVSKRLTVPEGSTQERTLDLVAAATTLPRAQLAAAVAPPAAALGLPAQADGRAEGYLFPATYELQPGASAGEVLTAMVDRFDQAASDVDLAAGAKARGLSEHEILTVASLVQAESARPEDDPKVARVIYNRLAKGMKLQLDSTVNYALKRSTLAVSLKDLEVRSPFNTYRVAGLPPGPINSPGEAALRAALEPAAGDWLYFVTTDPAAKVTEFTSSYQQFLKLKAAFEKSQQ